MWLVDQPTKRRAVLRETPVVSAEAPRMDDREVDELEDAVIERLAELIPALIAQIGVDEPAYFLALHWGAGFKTQICPATLRDRARLVARRPYKPFDAYLRYDHGGINCGLADWGMSAIEAIGERLELELCRRREHDRALAIRTEVVRRLNDVDLRGCMATTPDFLVGSLAGFSLRKDELAYFRANLDPGRFADLETRETARAEQLASRRSSERIIKRQTALAALEQTLGEAGVHRGSADHPDDVGRRAWEAFLIFLAIPVASLDPHEDQDMALVEQSPIPNEHGFTITLSRQLAKEDASGDHGGYAVVYINLRFDDCDEPPGVAPLSRWASPADVEAARAIPTELPALRHAIQHRTQAVNIEIARTDL